MSHSAYRIDRTWTCDSFIK